MADLSRQILDASVELVAEKGVRGVSFREVARRAGVSHQAPYHHFGNHLGIMRAIASEGFAGLTSAMQTAAAGAGGDAMDQFTAAGLAYVEFARNNLGHFRVMFERSLVDIHEGDAPMAEAEATYATLVGLAQQAHEAGYGRGLGPQEIAHLGWACVHGIAILLVEGVMLTKIERAETTEDAVARQVVCGLDRLLR